MRWIDPDINDTRERSGFLWRRKTDGDEYRWLEWAEWEESYQRVRNDGEDMHKWVVTRWMDD